jgi:hypothetical protein
MIWAKQFPAGFLRDYQAMPCHIADARSSRAKLRRLLSRLQKGEFLVLGKFTSAWLLTSATGEVQARRLQEIEVLQHAWQATIASVVFLEKSLCRQG